MSASRYFLLDVFTTQRFEGNPLAVFPEGDEIPPERMQTIAGELNLSETVFLTAASDGTSAARARIFSPRKELDFAGHPTIGSAYLLHALGRVTASFSIQENVGAVPIELERSQGAAPRFWLTTPPIRFAEELPVDLCAALLALDPSDFGSAPPQFVTAGSPLLFIQLKTPSAVDRVVVQAAVLPQALGSLNSGGTFIFAQNASADGRHNVYSRMFAPQIGIAEDAATGGATGPLAAYMRRHGLVPPSGDVNFVSEQGVKMGRRSLLHVRMRLSNNADIIQVGGSAVTVAEGAMTLD